MGLLTNYILNRRLSKLAINIKDKTKTIEVLNGLSKVLYTLYTTNVSITTGERTLITTNHVTLYSLIKELKSTIAGVSSDRQIISHRDYSLKVEGSLYDFCAYDTQGNYIAPSDLISTVLPLVDELNMYLSSIDNDNVKANYYRRALKYITSDLLVLATSINGVKQKR